MKNNLLTIGQMAKLNHTTLATLRLYDDKGLLKPKSVNPLNGYRTYDVCQSAVFHMIQYNKDLGLNLNEIKSRRSWIVRTKRFWWICITRNSRTWISR